MRSSVVKKFMILLYIFFGIGLVKASLDVTVVNEHPLVRDGAISYIKCVTDATEIPGEPFDRVLDTGSGSHMTSMILLGPISPESWPGKRLSMFPEGGLKRTGVFSCTVLDDGIEEVVQAIKIGTSGGIWPERFTQTVNVNEKADITFSSFDTTDAIWRHQGIIISSQHDLVHSIPQITTTHAGIYECYKPPSDEGDITSYRPLDQGIMRLIVRECPTDRWNPPNCGRSCKCMNGGACNHITGICVCPPGFKGDHCEEACGGNRFGAACQFACKQGGSSYGEDAEECRARQFCVADPYGCSCATGFQGLECSEGCALGMYGADCKQECHCKRPDLCNRFTGGCTLGCDVGWTGPSCQKACEPLTWGENCEQICHCQERIECDRFNGECANGRCAHPFSGSSCQTDLLDECMSIPCQQGGTCSDRILEYECTCINGTGGINCEIDFDECESSPCQNDGHCVDKGPLQFQCNCEAGFTGEICEENIDDCISHRCDNGAACIDEVDDYKCYCKTGFIGRYCEEICPPGSYHDENINACVLCDGKSYQEKTGQAFCLPCPVGTETRQNGTTSQEDCIASNILNMNASVDSLIFIIVGILGTIIVVAVIVLVWYYGLHKKKNRLEKVTIRRAW